MATRKTAAAKRATAAPAEAEKSGGLTPEEMQAAIEAVKHSLRNGMTQAEIEALALAHYARLHG